MYITWFTFKIQLVSLCFASHADCLPSVGRFPVVFYLYLFVELRCSQCLSVKTRENWCVPCSHYDAPWRRNGIHGFFSPIWSSSAEQRRTLNTIGPHRNMLRGAALRAAAHFEAQKSDVEWYQWCKWATLPGKHTRSSGQLKQRRYCSSPKSGRKQKIANSIYIRHHLTIYLEHPCRCTSHYSPFQLLQIAHANTIKQNYCWSLDFLSMRSLQSYVASFPRTSLYSS